MTDVQILAPRNQLSADLVMADVTSRSVSSATDCPENEFESCVSNLPQDGMPIQCPDSKHRRSGSDHDNPSPPFAEIPTNLDHRSDKNTTAGNLARSRYGLEPMSLVFASSTQESLIKDAPSERRAGNSVMSAVEPRRSSISIKRIGDYDLIKTIGAGSTGKVKLAIHRRTRERVAVKIVPRRQLDSPGRTRPNRETNESRERRILREAALLNLIDHPNIVKLKDFLITSDYFCLFFEYVEGLQLLDYIIMHGRLSEKEARTIFRQLLSAVHYCHHYSIVHRDLKIENILLDERTGTVKLLDFGLSNFYRHDELLNTFCGSLYFAAPELLSGTVYMGPEVDVWSLGIILYVLVTGNVPFDDKNLSILHAKIKACQLQISDRLSSHCRDLLSRMICRDPERRATMEQVLNHPWVAMTASPPPSYKPPTRPPLRPLDEAVISLLVRDFDMQYDELEIRRILLEESLNRDWNRLPATTIINHPIISIYLLARDKLYDANGAMRMATVQISSGERSRSLPFIYDTSDSSREFSVHLDAVPESSRVRSKSIGIADDHRGIIPVNNVAMDTTMMITPNDLDDELLNIRTVYLKGFFATHTRTTQGPRSIRNELIQYLIRYGIQYEDHRSYFICDHRPSIRGQYGRLVFEIHIVKLAFLGMHGLQFKRIYGDVSQYKRLQSEIISSINLT